MYTSSLKFGLITMRGFLYCYFGTTVATKVYQRIFVIRYNIFIFAVVASISMKAIMTPYRSYSVRTQN